MYYLWGLAGLAYSFVVGYALYFIIITVVNQYRYHYRRSRTLTRHLAYSTLILLFLLLLSYILHGFIYYIASLSLLSIIIIYYLKKLNQKTELFSYVRTKIGR